MAEWIDPDGTWHGLTMQDTGHILCTTIYPMARPNECPHCGCDCPCEHTTRHGCTDCGCDCEGTDR